MVKNEQDVIEPFVRHTRRFTDFHVILDNDSVDDTRSILTKLMRELDGVIVTTSSKFGYNQSERMTLLLQACQSAFFADYVVFLDADEFISCDNRDDFERHLTLVPVGGWGGLAWRTFVLTPSDYNDAHTDPPRSMRWRRRSEKERLNAVLRLDGKVWIDLVVAQGNHAVISSRGRPVDWVRLREAYLNHFPVRSVDQFVSKSVVGWLAYLAKGPSQEGAAPGYHWRENFVRIVRNGSIAVEALCDLSMQYDQPNTPYDWAADVVADDAHLGYRRLYSSGSFASPVSIIARSWQRTLESNSPVLSLHNTVGEAASRQAKPDTAFEAGWHWENPFADVAPFRYVMEKFRPASVLDVGCGIGLYLTLFKNLGSSFVFGLDGLPKASTMLADCEYNQTDLAQPFHLHDKFDLVLCLEVLEHVPTHAALGVLKSIASHASGLIVFSAAQPGQPGVGHINSQPIGYWLEEWRKLDWFPLLGESLSVRALATLPWFKRNCVLLKKGCDETSHDATVELAKIGEMPFEWSHTRPGIRLEVLEEAAVGPGCGYRSEV